MVIAVLRAAPSRIGVVLRVVCQWRSVSAVGDELTWHMSAQGEGAGHEHQSPHCARSRHSLRPPRARRARRGAPRHAEPCQGAAACSALGAGGHEIIAGLAPCLVCHPLRDPRLAICAAATLVAGGAVTRRSTQRDPYAVCERSAQSSRHVRNTDVVPERSCACAPRAAQSSPPWAAGYDLIA